MQDVGFAPLEVCPYTESQGEHCARPHTQTGDARRLQVTIQPIPGH